MKRKKCASISSLPISPAHRPSPFPISSSSFASDPLLFLAPAAASDSSNATAAANWAVKFGSRGRRSRGGDDFGCRSSLQPPVPRSLCQMLLSSHRNPYKCAAGVSSTDQEIVSKPF
ncbi:unnamed protein product [Urochloa humidicola]